MVQSGKYSLIKILPKIIPKLTTNYCWWPLVVHFEPIAVDFVHHLHSRLSLPRPNCCSKRAHHRPPGWKRQHNLCVFALNTFKIIFNLHKLNERVLRILVINMHCLTGRCIMQQIVHKLVRILNAFFGEECDDALALDLPSKIVEQSVQIGANVQCFLNSKND